MVFSSLTFLLVFLPLLMICYYAVPKRYVAARRYILMAFSFIFYACGEPIYFFAIVDLIGVGRCIGNRLPGCYATGVYNHNGSVQLGCLRYLRGTARSYHRKYHNSSEDDR